MFSHTVWSGNLLQRFRKIFSASFPGPLVCTAASVQKQASKGTLLVNTLQNLPPQVAAPDCILVVGSYSHACFERGRERERDCRGKANSISSYHHLERRGPLSRSSCAHAALSRMDGSMEAAQHKVSLTMPFNQGSKNCSCTIMAAVALGMNTG